MTLNGWALRARLRLLGSEGLGVGFGETGPDGCMVDPVPLTFVPALERPARAAKAFGGMEA